MQNLQKYSCFDDRKLSLIGNDDKKLSLIDNDDKKMSTTGNDDIVSI